MQNIITQIMNNLDIEATSIHTPDNERAAYNVRFNTIGRARWGNAERDSLDYEMIVTRSTSRTVKTFKVNISRRVENGKLDTIGVSQVRNERGNTVFNHDKYQGYIDAAMAHALTVETAALEVEAEVEAEVESDAQDTAETVEVDAPAQDIVETVESDESDAEVADEVEADIISIDTAGDAEGVEMRNDKYAQISSIEGDYVLAAELIARADEMREQGLNEAAESLDDAAATILVPASMRLVDYGLTHYAGTLARSTGNGVAAVRAVAARMRDDHADLRPGWMRYA